MGGCPQTIRAWGWEGGVPLRDHVAAFFTAATDDAESASGADTVRPGTSQRPPNKITWQLLCQSFTDPIVGVKFSQQLSCTSTQRLIDITKPCSFKTGHHWLHCRAVYGLVIHCGGPYAYRTA